MSKLIGELRNRGEYKNRKFDMMEKVALDAWPKNMRYEKIIHRVTVNETVEARRGAVSCPALLLPLRPFHALTIWIVK
jgi:hypothetical protein